MPAVSFLKAAEYQDGHPGYSDPLDEQNVPGEHDQPDRAVQVLAVHRDRGHLRRLRRLVRPPAPGDRERLEHRRWTQPICSSAPMTLGSYPDRCGFSQRLPMLVISPWTRANYVSDKLTNTSSITRFIEDNWLRRAADRRRLLRRDLRPPERARRPARLLHRAELPSGDPRPEHGRGRQGVTPRAAEAATVPTVAASAVTRRQPPPGRGGIRGGRPEANRDGCHVP